MGALLSLLGWLSPGGLTNLVGAVLTHLDKKTDVALDGFKAGAEADTARYQAALALEAETNRIKAAQNGWWGARLIILLVGVPCAVHFAAVTLDSTFRFNWAVAKLPAPYDTYEWVILQSFFLVKLASPLVSATSAWLAARR